MLCKNMLTNTPKVHCLELQILDLHILNFIF